MEDFKFTFSDRLENERCRIIRYLAVLKIEFTADVVGMNRNKFSELGADWEPEPCQAKGSLLAGGKGNRA